MKPGSTLPATRAGTATRRTTCVGWCWDHRRVTGAPSQYGRRSTWSQISRDTSLTKGELPSRITTPARRLLESAGGAAGRLDLRQQPDLGVARRDHSARGPHPPGPVEPWREGLTMPGLRSIEVLRRLFDDLSWWRLRPAPELLTEQPGERDRACSWQRHGQRKERWRSSISPARVSATPPT